MYLYIYACNYNMMSLYRILRSVTLFTRLSMVQGRFRISTSISRTIDYLTLWIRSHDKMSR